MLSYRRFEKETDYDLMRGILQSNCEKTGHLFPQFHVGNLDFERFSFDESPDMIYENIHLIYQEEKGIGFLDLREDEFFITLETGKEGLKAEILDYVEKSCYPKGALLSTDSNSEDSIYVQFLTERGFEKTGGSRFHGICDLTELAPFHGLPEGYSIRKTTLKDLPKRAELYSLATGGVKTTEQQYERMMKGPAYKDALDLVVEEEAGDIVAYCTFWNDPISKIGILEPLACVSEHRRKGITKALLLYGMNELKKLGTRYMYVGTGGKNVASQGLYKSVGFKPHGMDFEWQKNPLKKIKDYKHVIWDWNGTLLDDQWLCLEIINKMLGKRGIKLLTKEDYKNVFGFPIKEYYERLGFDFKAEHFEALSEEYISEYDARTEECGLHEEIPETLKALGAMGISQSILSASREVTLRQVVKGFGIHHHFVEISGLDNDYAASKIDIGKSWLKTQRFLPHEAVMLGDTEHDFQTASAMGTDCILIANGHQSVERLRKCGTRVIESVRALREELK